MEGIPPNLFILYLPTPCHEIWGKRKKETKKKSWNFFFHFSTLPIPYIPTFKPSPPLPHYVYPLRNGQRTPTGPYIHRPNYPVFAMIPIHLMSGSGSSTYQIQTTKWM